MGVGVGVGPSANGDAGRARRDESWSQGHGEIVSAGRLSSLIRAGGVVAFAVVAGALAKGVAEASGEVERVGVADVLGDLGDGEAGAFEELPGALEALGLVVLLGRGAELFAEEVGESGGGEVGGGGELIDGKWLVESAVDEVEHGAQPGVQPGAGGVGGGVGGVQQRGFEGVHGQLGGEGLGGVLEVVHGLEAALDAAVDSGIIQVQAPKPRRHFRPIQVGLPRVQRVNVCPEQFPRPRIASGAVVLRGVGEVERQVTGGGKECF